ncbi:extracellular solute-binding protein [Oceanidesulfovibrio marinus]|uniref:Extracellular solute-binding protein n=2 Tax=Oceanidesulfovibrio marinus TaxID=370038 RepID=A0ABX6NAG5_9BACT|nr:extracellular solute-binding protein [Oceanidesulfovibrio marinus]
MEYATMITLKGMTWDHPRGYAPLEKASELYRERHPEVEISWTRRSLQAFADRPLSLMTKEYDLLIIDHPHVGEAERDQSLLPLNGQGYDDMLEEFSRRTVGPSYASYDYHGSVWALPVDAAAQVACWRPDLLDAPPRTWDEVVALAEKGQVTMPLKPIDAMASFCTLSANIGHPVARDEGRLLDMDAGREVFEALLAVARHMEEQCFSNNPIEVLERMSRTTQFAYCPLLYGYNSYSREDVPNARIAFNDIPALGDNGPCGSMIGGAGIAVSSSCERRDVALDFAFFIMSGEAQSGFYFDAQGQPGHLDAWESDRTNRLSLDFFRNTRKTMDTCWLRPRYDGFLGFMDKAGNLVNATLRGQGDVDETLKQLEELYQASRGTRLDRDYD